MMRAFVLGVAAVLAIASASAGQDRPRCAVAQPSSLVVYGTGLGPTSFTLAALREMPALEVTATGHHDEQVVYTGVLLRSVLSAAAVTPSDSLRGKALLQYLVAEARDGYRAALTLAEADTSYRSDRVIVAYEANGAPLNEEVGPLQLIVEADRRHRRWVRQLDCVRVARDTIK